MPDAIFEVLHATCPAVVERLPNADYFVEAYRFTTPEAAWQRWAERRAESGLYISSPADYVIVRRVPTGESNHKGPTWRIDWTFEPIKASDLAKSTA